MIIDKTNVGLAVVLAALIGTSIATNRGSVYEQSKSPETNLDLFPGFDAKSAVRIEVSQPQKTVKDGKPVEEIKKIELEKQGDVWVVASSKGFPAKPDKVQALLEKVQGFKRGQTASINPDHHAGLGVDASGKVCKVFGPNGTPMAHLYVGSPAAGGRATMIRKEGMNEVYVAPDNLAQTFGAMPTNWYDNLVCTFKPEEVVSATLEYGDAKIALSKDSESNWKVTEPEAFDAEKRVAESLIRPVANLRFQDVAGKYEPGKYGLEQPSWRLTLTMGDGKSLSVRAGAETGEHGIFVQKEGNEFVFEVNRSLIQTTLTKKVDDFKPKPKPETPPPADGSQKPADGGTKPPDDKKPEEPKAGSGAAAPDEKKPGAEQPKDEKKSF